MSDLQISTLETQLDTKKDHKTKSQKDSPPQKNCRKYQFPKMKTLPLKQHHESSADITMRSNFTLGVFYCAFTFKKNIVRYNVLIVLYCKMILLQFEVGYGLVWGQDWLRC